MYLASVYCIDTGAQQRNPNLMQDVYEQISVGLTHYASKPGTLCLWGIGAHMRLPRRTRLSPATCFIWFQLLVSGTPTLPAWSYLTSALLMASGLFPSTSICSCPRAPSWPALPSHEGNAKPSSTISSYLPGLSPSSAQCEVVPQTSADVHGVGSDHAPVLLPCPPHPPRAPARGNRRVTLRLERLFDPTTKKEKTLPSRSFPRLGTPTPCFQPPSRNRPPTGSITGGCGSRGSRLSAKTSSRGYAGISHGGAWCNEILDDPICR
jgi:hypothetical protein